MNRNLLRNSRQINGRFALLVVLLFCVLGAKGQTISDGVYYIKTSTAYAAPGINGAISGISPDDFTPGTPYYWYIWPSISTTDPTGYNALDNGSGIEYYRYITTLHRTNAPAYYRDNTHPSWDAMDSTYCHWAVKYIGSSGSVEYYQIINPKLNKYLIWTKVSGVRHTQLEGTPDRIDLNRSYFDLEQRPDGDFRIHTRNVGNSTYNTSVFNVSKDDKPHLSISGSSHEPIFNSSSSYGNGLIQGTTNSQYYKKYVFEEELFSAPTISAVNPSTNRVTVTDVNGLPAGYNIRYTVSTDTNTPPADPTASSPIMDAEGYNVAAPCIIKVVVERYGVVLTEVATSGVLMPSDMFEISFEVTCDSKLQITCTQTAAIIYYNYTTDGTEPSNPDDGSDQYTTPLSLPDNAWVKTIAYNGPIVSSIFSYNPFLNNTASPTINLYETYVEIAFGTGVTIHYTTDGSEPDPEDTGVSTSPFTITGLSYDSDFELRVVATSSGRGNSCPVTIVKRPKQPTIEASNECFGVTRIQTLAFNGTEEGKTYWYALSNGAGQPVPALNTFTEYTPGSTIDIADIPAWNGSDIWVTLHAYAMTADGYASHVVTEDYMLKFTDAPIITHSGNSVTITATMGATIRYSVDGGSQQTATTTTTFTVATGQNHTITAMAQLGSEGESCETVHAIVNPTTITTLQQLNSMTVNGAYVLGADIENAGSYTTKGTDANPFIGYFDGAGFTISGLNKPLFGTTYGAVIHDVNLKEVQISEASDVGAIVCDAKGYTRIYNCGILPTNADFSETTRSSVASTGSGSAGGIVGKLEDDSRVVNCFSYADVSSTGYAAGIVGNNTFASTTEVNNGKYYKLRTMVVNCMFYGDITNGSSIWPVYGGTKITNAGSTAINNYNFYSDSCHFASAFQDYNCSWPAKYDYLTRYEFLRYLLNSNRELCGWWVGAPSAPSTMATSAVQAVPKDASLMAKWVLDPSVAPFPILKPFGYYSSPINIDADASWRTSANKWEGKKLGTLSVTINPGGHAASGITSTTKTIVITDMDTIHGDYCYRKIQLPYYNNVFGNPNSTDWTEKYGGNYKDYVVTGWEITSTDGADGTFTAHWQDGYNFTDRYCSKKDKYSESGRVFAQGGYYYVPYDVTEITITAHWGTAIYLGNGDNYYDRVDFDYLYNHTNTGANYHPISDNSPGTAFSPAGTRSGLGNGETIYTGKIATVAENLPNTGSVFDNALVLVGNHQYCTGNENVAPSRSFTIMSADFDFDNEPDYCLDWQLGRQILRYSFCPIRFDFLPVVEIGLCLKKDGSTQYYSLGCYRPLGHFEVTETALIRFGQFEFSNRSRSLNAPIILNGGIYDQYTKGHNNYCMTSANDRIDYVIIGGNVYMPSFTPGAHVNSSYSTRHCAVNAIGGKFDYLYLTGNYNEGVRPNADNPHCYIDGGWFGQIAAAGKEGIGDPTLSEPKGNVFFKINHAVIHEFYGGSTLADKRVTGNIDVTIDSSMVTKYCGGPKFGDMYDGKTVYTRATGTIFKNYYGGGNGGTSYVQYKNTDGEKKVEGFNWYIDHTTTNGGSMNSGSYEAGRYRDTDSEKAPNTYEANYDMNIINVSTGTDMGYAVFRTYFYAAQFSATNTGTISNELTRCKVLVNFYGGGFLGGIEGDVNSTLTDTEVLGSAFGAGYSASIPTVDIYELGVPPTGKTPPTIDVYTGIITPQSGGTKTTYTWCHRDPETQEVFPEGVVIPGDVGTGNPGFTDDNGDNYFYTTVSLRDLGMVTGNVTLTIKGNSVIGTLDANNQLVEKTGNVYGGGDQSKVNGNIFVKLQGNTNVRGNVYGGGNLGNVNGDTSVSIEPEP